MSPVFPDSLGGLRDLSNTRQSLRVPGLGGLLLVKSHVYPEDGRGAVAPTIADTMEDLL